MEYIKKDDIMEKFTALRDARKAKMNCNRQSAIEYQVFNYVVKILESMKTENIETDNNV